MKTFLHLEFAKITVYHKTSSYYVKILSTRGNMILISIAVLILNPSEESRKKTVFLNLMFVKQRVLIILLKVTTKKYVTIFLNIFFATTLYHFFIGIDFFCICSYISYLIYSPTLYLSYSIHE